MRVKSPRLRRHKKVLNLASGYRRSHAHRYKLAKEAVIHAGQYAFAGRRLKKRNLRTTWIIRIKAALENLGFKYSQFISALKTSNIEIDRKILSEIATHHPEVFAKIVKSTNRSSSQ